MQTDEFTLTSSYIIVDRKNGTSLPLAASEDLETAWQEAKDASNRADAKAATLHWIGIHSNYGNPLQGDSTTPFVRGNACNTVTRYTNPA